MNTLLEQLEDIMRNRDPDVDLELLQRQVKAMQPTDNMSECQRYYLRCAKKAVTRYLNSNAFLGESERHDALNTIGRFRDVMTTPPRNWRPQDDYQ